MSKKTANLGFKDPHETGTYSFKPQTIFVDDHGTARFAPNRIVNDMLEAVRGGVRMDMNSIACNDKYSDEERMQFAQLIGYSVSSYGDLSYVSDASVRKADKIVEKMSAAIGACEG